MVVNARSTSPHPPRGGGDAGERAARVVVWHDLECGSYRADLPLWRELAAAQDGPILDVGAGAGRVTLDLARAGQRVTALDLDPDLLGALSERAAGEGLEVETVRADARSFDLSRHGFGLCLAPMQTLQLLGGSAARVAFLRRARAHLRPGGLLACAIVTVLEPFDCAGGDVGPTPEIARVGDTVYLSRATRVAVLDRGVAIERERRVVPSGGRRGGDAPGDGRPAAAEPAVERNVIELDRVNVAQLEREGIEVGLLREPARQISATADHVGSAVVMLRA
jgi:SAM-dependent methyltransferase